MDKNDILTDFRGAIMRLSVIAFAVSFAFMAQAGSYYLKESMNGTVVDWTSGDSYEGGAAPSDASADLVYIPENVTVNVDNTTVAGLSTFRRIVPSTNSVIAIAITTNASVSCAITSYGEVRGDPGAIEKSGSGTLVLASGNKVTSASKIYDYYADMAIQEGDVQLPSSSDAKDTIMLSEVDVGDNCTLYLSEGTQYHEIKYLTGAGLVTNKVTDLRTMRLSGYGEIKSFPGKISGKIRIQVTGSANLTGVENMTASQGLYITPASVNAVNDGAGIAGLLFFGTSTQAASGGNGQYLYLNGSGATLRYLGTGETSTKKIGLQKTNVAYPVAIDAGPHGNITLAGSIEPSDTDPNVHRLVLKGTNPVEAVVAAVMETKTVGTTESTNIMMHITKQGTGTWRFSSVNQDKRETIGGIAVEEGTLAFDTIAEAGEYCSLGNASAFVETNLVPSVEGNFVPYAFRLGNPAFTPAADPVLEYVGSSAAACSTRPIVVYGNGHLKNSGTGQMRFSGISAAVGSTNATIVLGGDSAAFSSAETLTDGTRGEKLNVAKDGSGTWTLSTNSTFSGRVDVKAGTLILRNPDKYTYFKFTVRETWARYCGTPASDTRSKHVQLSELVLYDQNGIRLNKGMEYVSGYDINNLLGNTAMYERNNVLAHSSDYGPANTFDDSSSTYWWGDTTYYTDAEDDTTWVSMIMRLPDDSAEVASYDFLATQTVTPNSAATANGVRCPRIFSLSGSTDGINWHVLNVTNVMRTTANKWAADTAPSATDSTSNPYFVADAVRTGFPVNVSCTPSATAFADISTVSVAAGATLKVIGSVTLKGLTVSTAGNGTIRGATFGANGTIDMTDVSDPLAAVAGMTFTDVRGLENLANWSLLVNGRPVFGYRLFYANGQFRLTPKGLTINFK